MLRSLAPLAALLLSSSTEAISFLKKKAKANVTPALGNAYKTSTDACCACFKRKYAWPENAGLSATFAPSKTCDTCYVSDRFGIDSRSAAIFESPVVSSASTGGEDLRDVATPAAFGCQDVCDTQKGCGYKYVSPDGIETDKEYYGPQACERFVADPLLVQEYKKNFG